LKTLRFRAKSLETGDSKKAFRLNRQKDSKQDLRFKLCKTSKQYIRLNRQDDSKPHLRFKSNKPSDQRQNPGGGGATSPHATPPEFEGVTNLQAAPPHPAPPLDGQQQQQPNCFTVTSMIKSCSKFR